MTNEEIQKIINKGGYLCRRFDTTSSFLLFKPTNIGDVYGINTYYRIEPSGIILSEGQLDSWDCSGKAWREATPEEIKLYVK